jgi:uncharacterized protein (TIGR02996 family)
MSGRDPAAVQPLQRLLRDAATQLASGDPSFYETVRAAWRECRCAELGELIERLGRAHGRAKLGEPKLKRWHAAWIERAREGDPLDLAGQLDGLLEHMGSRHASMVASCLDELGVHADDPQLTVPLLKLLEVPAASSAWNKVHTRIFQLLEATGDPRSIRGLEPAIERSAVTGGQESDSMRASLARAARTKERLAARFPDGVPSLPEGLEAAVAELSAIRTAVAPSSARPKRADHLQVLLEAIWADPWDDELRIIYADALQTRGDPRGELIALQSSDRPDAPAKAARLIDKHRRALLGPLAKAVVASTAVFERGFLAACETDVRRKVEAEVVFSRPEWATVKRLGFRSSCVLSPEMRSLEEVRGVTEPALELLAQGDFPRVELLSLAARGSFGGMRGGRPTSAGLRALAATTGLPKLRELHLGFAMREWDHGFRTRTAADFAWLLAAPAAARLETLGFRCQREDQEALRSWLVTLRGHRTLTRLIARTPNAVLTVTKRGSHLEAVIHFPNFRGDVALAPPWATAELAALTAALDGMPLTIADRVVSGGPSDLEAT